MHNGIIVLLLALTKLSLQTDYLCPGFNFAFWSFPGGGSYRWAITEDNCNVVSTCGNANPCTCDNLGCSPAPAHVEYIKVDKKW